MSPCAKPCNRRFRRFGIGAFVLALSTCLFLISSAEADLAESGIEQSDYDSQLGGQPSVEQHRLPTISKFPDLAEGGIEQCERPLAEDTLPAFAEGAAAFATGAAQAIKDGSATLKEAAARLSEQHAALVQAANQAVAQLAEQKDAFVQAAAAQLADRKAEITETATLAAAQLADRLAEGPAILKAAAERVGEQQITLQEAASEALAQLSSWKIKATEIAQERAASFASGVAEQKAAAATHFTEQKDALVQAAGQAAAQLADRQAEFKESATQAAAQLTERFAEGSAALKAAAERVGEQHPLLQGAASEALSQLTNWKVQATEAATQKAALFAEGVNEHKVALAEVAAQAVSHFSEQQAALRDAVAAVGAQLSEHQAMLTQAASQAAAQLTHFCVGCGQDALRQATATATAQLAEHEMLLRQSATLIATQLANFQATLSPSAGRIVMQFAELQQRIRELEDDDRRRGVCFEQSAKGPRPCTTEPAAVAASTPRPFALPYLLFAKTAVQNCGCELPVACCFLAIVAFCVGSTIYTICCGGGENASSLSYGCFVRRAMCWLVHRVFLGWALLILSDAMAEAPLHIRKYDAMSWPMWSTLMPLSTQLCFFVPAAAILNTAVARGSSCYSTPESRRFYASLSREVHASIVGCFVSDWLLFPTDIVFFGHHVLGLGIIFGVWSMVLGEARLLSEASPQLRSLTTMNFWWVTGLSVASMEASSFFYNLYSVMSFGAILNLSLFAVFTYSNLLSLMCVLAQHPWGTSIKVIWAAGSFLNGLMERAQAAFPQVHIPWWLSSKTTSDSVSYFSKGFMVTIICLARHHQMWCYVREKLSFAAVFGVSTSCALLAGASVWRLRDFERRAML